jgi:hypothetical protein
MSICALSYVFRVCLGAQPGVLVLFRIKFSFLQQLLGLGIVSGVGPVTLISLAFAVLEAASWLLMFQSDLLDPNFSLPSHPPILSNDIWGPLLNFKFTSCK